ncbi:MAG: MMPL family transporter, partial [Deltaproteobacteria bacterium]|nr:MMPL family transporter [Deltaproteobacteria bacterium]
MRRLVNDQKRRANPLYVDLEEDGNAESWRDTFKKILPKRKVNSTHLKRFFVSPDGKYLFLRVKPSGTSYDMREGAKLLADIKAIVHRASPERFGVSVRYAGGLVVNQEQYVRMGADMRRVSVVSLILIVLLVAFYARRIAAPLVFAIPLVAGMVVSLAVTTLLFGQLNLVSALLISALFGLGIDFEVHLYLRFLEEFSALGSKVEAMKKAIVAVFYPALISAFTTAAAFFAIALSDFRGFREYGIIAGIGVLIALGSTFVVLPPVAMVLTRKPGRRRARKGPSTLRWIVAPIVVGFVVTLALVWGPKLRWHNDFRQLRGTSEAVDFS